jgi:cytochrome P450
LTRTQVFAKSVTLILNAVSTAKPKKLPPASPISYTPQPDTWLWTDQVFKAFSFPFTLDEVPDVMRAWGELDDYVDDMVARRRQTLTDDLLSGLIRVVHDGDRLNADELRMLAAALLLAGTDTTRNQVAASIDVLCDHPDKWELL